jgi:hypothetical protein
VAVRRSQGRTRRAVPELPHGFALYLGSCLIEAIDDWAGRVGEAPSDLYEAFLGWSVEQSMKTE